MELMCQLKMSGVRECVRVPHSEEEMCGDLCDLLMDVCLGVVVWPHV